MGIKETVKCFLTARRNEKYIKELAEKKCSYESWVKQDESKKKVSVQDSAEDFVIWKLSDGVISKGAMSQLTDYFMKHPEVKVLYGDEDVMGVDGVRKNPWVKPCWSPDTYKTYFYVGSVVAVRKSLLTEMDYEGKGPIIEYRDTEEIRERMDRILVKAGAFEKGNRAVQRVPYVLFHATSDAIWDTHFVSKCSILEPQAEAKVSVIIPSKDNPDMLKQCLDSLRKQDADLDIIVVDNGSNEDNRRKIELLTEGMKYIYRPMEFNFSQMCNIGARAATNSLLLFLNDDIELDNGAWLERMCQKAVNSYVGAVGLKLYYPNGNLIQHAGVVNMPVGPDHKLRTLPDTEAYYFGFNKYTHNCSAVTGACLMVEAKKYWEIGGFEEKLAVCYNDVDLCFRLYEQGYHNVVINEFYAWHHESVSRGSDEENPEKQARFLGEWTRLYEYHPGFVEEDPYYPIEMDRFSLNNKIQPAYIYGIYSPQKPAWKAYTGIKGLRKDPCLMARVEMYDKKKILGYGIVLGDDNACYERYLVLSPAPESDNISSGSFWLKLEGKYRYELEQNVPDQKNVALCGYYISREEENLPSGSYRVGMIAVNKVTGLKLFNWCGKVMEV